MNRWLSRYQILLGDSNLLPLERGSITLPLVYPAVIFSSYGLLINLVNLIYVLDRDFH